MLSRALRRTADALLAVLLAPTCAACKHPLDHPTRSAVCERCWTSIAPLPPIVCSPELTVLRRAAAVGAYEGSLRDIIHALKYDGRRSLARPLGELMRVRSQDVLDGADVVVPVPLHWWRRYRRGFNQAEELARALGLPVAHLLRRTRRTRTQTDLPEDQRHANVRNAFRVPRQAPVRGRTIVLVDDVTTTGATLEACAKTLLKAGASEVRALTAARVASRRR